MLPTNLHSTLAALPIYQPNDICYCAEHPLHPDVYIVNVKGKFLLCKCTSIYRQGCMLTEELVHYNILAESPYILPIQGFVQDPNGDLEGLLLPYLGAEAVLWHEDEWNCAQKEILSAALMDAVWDIVRRGVELTDVKGDNVLLGSDGIKLIDLDTRATTGAWGSTKGNLTVRRLGCTLSAVWNERHYPDYFVPPGTPQYIADLIMECATQRPITSVDEIYCKYRSRMVDDTSSELWKTRRPTEDQDWEGNLLSDIMTRISDNARVDAGANTASCAFEDECEKIEEA